MKHSFGVGGGLANEHVYTGRSLFLGLALIIDRDGQTRI